MSIIEKLLGLALGISILIIGWLGWELKTANTLNQKAEGMTDKAEVFEFLSQRIFVENPNDVFVGMMPLREAINTWIGGKKNKISLYFEYLPSGTSIGVNEKEEYQLASLFKLPVVMATVLRIERREEKKDRELILSSEVMDKNFGDWWKKETGTIVTVQEAITAAIIDSDNTAYNLLLKSLPDGYLVGMLRDFDISVEQTSLGYYPVGSAKGYASLFRGLYLSTLLSKKGSNDLLTLLTQTKFGDRLPAGVDGEVKVAHKYGEFQIDDPDKIVYSDCGIVYVPKRPYILCIMTQGSKDETREQTKYLSKMVYQYVLKVNLQE